MRRSSAETADSNAVLNASTSDDCGNSSSSDDLTSNAVAHKRQHDADVEQRRQQNRDAAARHRQRQQSRLDELVRKEAVLKQRVAELEREVQALQRGRVGLPLPERDTFTDTIVEMVDSVDALRAGLKQCTEECESLVSELVQIADTVMERAPGEG